MYLNVALYRFANIPGDLLKLRELLLASGKHHALRGTILLAPEGVNAFLCGSENQIREFLSFLGQSLQTHLEWKESWSETQAFKKFLVKVKKEIITFDGGLSKPIEGRAASVDAKTLLRWLNEGKDDDGLPLILVDTRNDVEIAEGTFEGALDLRIGKFTDFKTRILEKEFTDQFDNKRVVTFCTGGIRCEKAAIYMEQQGLKNVVQLEGGILKYFEEVGGQHWEGGCFVFDERENIAPDLTPLKRRGIARSSN